MNQVHMIRARMKTFSTSAFLAGVVLALAGIPVHAQTPPRATLTIGFRPGLFVTQDSVTAAFRGYLANPTSTGGVWNITHTEFTTRLRQGGATPDEITGITTALRTAYGRSNLAIAAQAGTEGATLQIDGQTIPVNADNRAQLRTALNTLSGGGSTPPAQPAAPPSPPSSICIVVAPGQSASYGRLQTNPPESTLNRTLREHNGTFLETNITESTETIGVQVRGTVIPTPAQAQEFVNTGFRYYHVHGVAVSPGAYPVGRPQQVPATGRWVRANSECVFQEVAAPVAPPPNQPPFPPGVPPGPPIQDIGQGGQGNQGGGGWNNPLFALLPTLLQSLFQQRQQPQQQSAPPPPPPPPAAVALPPASAFPPVACTQDYAPVCGVDGKDYPNRCVAEKQFGVAVSRLGTCVTPSVGNVGTVFQQLAQSGAPDSLFEDMARAITALVLSFLRGGLTVGETVVQ